MFCVYEHIRPDTNTIFYVGKGSYARAHSKHRRNKHWNNVVSKAGGYSVRVIVNDVDEELSFFVEQERIDQLKRIGLKLTNKTDGGEGPSGFRHTDEAKRKIAKAQMGENHWTFGRGLSDEHKEKLRKAREFFVFTDEIRKKISEAGKRRIYTPETLVKMSNAKQGRKHHMANAIEFDGKVFGTAKELSDYTGVKYGTIRTRIRLYPEKFGYKLLGYTKDFKGLFNDSID